MKGFLDELHGSTNFFGSGEVGHNSTSPQPTPILARSLFHLFWCWLRR